MEFIAEEILARMKADLKNEDSRIEGSFSMDNLQAVAEELARIANMQIKPIRDEIDQKIDETITSGNERHYEFWAEQTVDENGNKLIGKARAKGDRDGSRIVNIAVVTPLATQPTEEVLAIVTDYIESQRPVGAKPVVKAADKIEVEINGIITLKEGTLLESVVQKAKTLISMYLAEIAFQSGNTVLNYYKISSILEEMDEVKEIISYTINGGKESLPADFDQYFELKGLVLNVSST